MSPEQLSKLLEAGSRAKLQSPLDDLDERELEVFSILAQGYSPAQIESEFGITRADLKAIKLRLLRKLHLKDELALLRLTAQHGQTNRP